MDPSRKIPSNMKRKMRGSNSKMLQYRWNGSFQLQNAAHCKENEQTPKQSRNGKQNFQNNSGGPAILGGWSQISAKKIGLKHVVSPQTTNQTSITIQKGLDSVCYIMIIMVYHGLSRYHFLCTNSKNSCANYQETSFWLLVYITCKRSIENKMPL